MNYVWEQRKFSELYKKVNEKNIFRFGVDKIISVANMYFKEDVKKPNDEYMRTYNIMRLGDIAFEGNKSKNFSHGRFVENTIGDGIVSHVFDVFRPVMDYDLLFWKYLINNENVMGRIMTRCTKASTMMTNLVAKDFLNENILVPTIEEQHKIGTYIDKLDHLITLHQRKIYIFIKKMPIDWEQRKLGDVLSLLKDGTHGTHRDAESGPLLLSAKNIKNGTVQWDESDRRISEDEYNIIHSNFRLQKGDVLLTIVGSIGEVAILSQSEGVTFQRSVAFLRPSDEICSEFLYSEIQGQKFQKELNDRKSTSAQPGMYLGDLGAIPIEFPTSDEEQMQIGSYFSTIDHLITLHHRKCIILRKMKVNDWEQRKVGDYLTESREIGNKGDVARKMTVKLWGKGVYEKLEAGSTNTQYFIRHANQFIYSKLDFLNCAFGVVPEELESLETTADVPAFDCVYMNPYFMFYRTIQPSFYIQNGIIANGSRKAKRIHTDTFLEMPISVPCLTEQNKIVGYFQSLDHLITLHQHKCDELQNLKKYMLQNMFV